MHAMNWSTHAICYGQSQTNEHEFDFRKMKTEMNFTVDHAQIAITDSENWNLQFIYETKPRKMYQRLTAQ